VSRKLIIELDLDNRILRVHEGETTRVIMGSSDFEGMVRLVVDQRQATVTDGTVTATRGVGLRPSAPNTIAVQTEPHENPFRQMADDLERRINEQAEADHAQRRGYVHNPDEIPGLREISRRFQEEAERQAWISLTRLQGSAAPTNATLKFGSKLIPGRATLDIGDEEIEPPSDDCLPF
jgi:hypothetical protein